jgi:hypothetical protein
MRLNLVSLQRRTSKRKHFADKPISAAVALEESNLGDLRKMVHKDAAGNVISKPPKLCKPMFDQWILMALAQPILTAQTRHVHDSSDLLRLSCLSRGT